MYNKTKYKKLPDISFPLLVQVGGLLSMGGYEEIDFYPYEDDPLVKKLLKKGNSSKTENLKRHMNGTLDILITLDNFATYLTTGYNYWFATEELMLFVYNHFERYLKDDEYNRPGELVSINQMNAFSFEEDRLEYIDKFCQLASRYKNGYIQAAEAFAKIKDNVESVSNIQSNLKQINLLDHMEEEEMELVSIFKLIKDPVKARVRKLNALDIKRGNNLTQSALRSQANLESLANKTQYKTIFKTKGE